MARSTVLALLATATLLGCESPPGEGTAIDARGTSAAPGTPVTAPVMGLRYVALGDSYTIGTSVSLDARWPNQLVDAVDGARPVLTLIANLGVNGYTSRDVIDVELPQLDALRPEFVTLLVGVNDVVQGVSADAYRGNVAAILDALVARVGGERTLVITTPDYTVTPAGADFGDPVQQSAAIRINNEIMSSLAAARGITVIDIYDISRRAVTDRSLVASDGLHPSGAQYGLWIERIAPAVVGLLSQ